MTIVGVLAVLIGFLTSMVAFVTHTKTRGTIFVLAYLMHISASIIYFRFVEGGVADAALYYYDFLGIYEEGFGLNTSFIIYVVQAMRFIFGGSYFDYFLIFQGFGFLGIAILMRIFEEIYAELGVEQPVYIYLMIFLPSIHYWTSSLGKDSLFFSAMCLSLWAVMQLRRRVRVLAFAMLIMLLIRPHVAVVALAALAITVVRDKSMHVAVRLLFFLVAAVGTGLGVATVWTTFRIDLTDANAVSDALSGREALVQMEDAGRTAVDAPYPLRVLSLLFRPFFFDAGGALGVVVSLENALLLLMVGMMLYHRRASMKLIRTVPYARYAIASSIGILLMLAIGYYNVGLGIRQKATMILPGLLVMFVTLRAVLAARKHQLTAAESRETKHATA